MERKKVSFELVSVIIEGSGWRQRRFFLVWSWGRNKGEALLSFSKHSVPSTTKERRFIINCLRVSCVKTGRYGPSTLTSLKNKGKEIQFNSFTSPRLVRSLLSRRFVSIIKFSVRKKLQSWGKSSPNIGMLYFFRLATGETEVFH